MEHLATPCPRRPPATGGNLEAASRATHRLTERRTSVLQAAGARGTYLDVVRLAHACRMAGPHLGHQDPADGKVEMLFVDPADAGGGIGRALLEHAVAQGARAVDVNEQNPQAVGFYLRMGCQQGAPSSTARESPSRSASSSRSSTPCGTSSPVR